MLFDKELWFIVSQLNITSFNNTNKFPSDNHIAAIKEGFSISAQL